MLLALSVLRRHGTAASAGAAARRIWDGLKAPEPRLILALTALGIAGTAIPTGGWTPIRTLFVVPLALFLPGYALTCAIFPRRRPARVERIVLALGLSLVAAALASLVLYVASFELTLHSWAAALAVITVGATLTAAARPSSASDRATLRGPRPALRPRSVATLIAAATLVATAVVLARTPLSSPSAPGYTALWLTRDSGSPDIILGVRSEEHRRTRYVLRLKLSGRTIERHLTLSPSQTWQERLSPTRRATASLYRVGRPGVYRSVRLGTPSKTGR